MRKQLRASYDSLVVLNKGSNGSWVPVGPIHLKSICYYLYIYIYIYVRVFNVGIKISSYLAGDVPTLGALDLEIEVVSLAFTRGNH